MWALVQLIGRRYVLLPVAIVGGAIGLFIESSISDRSTPSLKESIQDIRIERMVKSELSTDPTQVDSLKEKKFVPKSVFEKNLPPSLRN